MFLKIYSMKKERQRIDVNHALISIVGKSMFTVNKLYVTERGKISDILYDFNCLLWDIIYIWMRT
jgi:hypothetical protein